MHVAPQFKLFKGKQSFQTMGTNVPIGLLLAAKGALKFGLSTLFVTFWANFFESLASTGLHIQLLFADVC